MKPGKWPWMGISARCKRHSGESRALAVAIQNARYSTLTGSICPLDAGELLVVCTLLQPDDGQHYTCPGEATNFSEASRGTLVLRDLPIPLKSTLRSPSISQPYILHHTSYKVHALQEDARREKKGKKSYQRPTGMITEDEFSYLTAHPPRHLRCQSHRYGTLGTGMPGVFRFLREEALPAFCLVNSAWHRL